MDLLHEQAVELLLSDRRPARRLADGDELRVAPREAQDLGVYEPVVQDHVRRREQLPAAEGDQIRAAGSRADEVRLATALAVVARPGFDPALERAHRVRVSTRERVLRDLAADDALPEMTALVRVGNRITHTLAPRARELCECAGALWYDGLDQSLDPAREHGRKTAAADCDRHRGAVDDGGHDEGAERGVVDHVAKAMRGRGRRGDPRVQRTVVGRRDDEPICLERLAVERPCVMRDLPCRREVRECIGDLRRDDMNLGAGAK